LANLCSIELWTKEKQVEKILPSPYPFFTFHEPLFANYPPLEENKRGGGAEGNEK
jgi:hypothetical protein